MSTEGKTITCRAAVAWEYKKPVSVEQIEVLPPGHMEVRVKILAVGLCHTDLNFVDGYKSDHGLPFVLGHEGGGIIESIGPGVTHLKPDEYIHKMYFPSCIITRSPGDKVLTMFLPQCGKCDVCKDSRDNMCLDIGRQEKRITPITRSLGYDGTPRFFCKGKALHYSVGCSSFTEYTVIPENSCVKINPKAPLEKMCFISCGFTTGYGAAANAVDIRPGDKVALWGMGCIGLAATMACKEKGATKIIGIDVNPDKEAIARKMGCTDFLCVKNIKDPIQMVIKQMTGGGVHFAFACVGNPSAMEAGIYSTKSGGTCVLCGVTSETAILRTKPLLFFPNRKLIGTMLGGYKIFDAIPKLVDRYMEGELPLDDFITGYYKLEQINEAMDAMAAGKTIRPIILM